MKQVKISDLIIPKYYSSFNDTKHTHQIFTSGRAGTKSSKMAIRSVLRIVSPKPGAVVIIRKFHNKLKKTVFKEVLRAITRLSLDKNDFKITVSPMQITYRPTGNTIYFTGSESIDDTKGMIDENAPIVLVVLDELTEFFERGEGEDELINIEATFIRGNDEEFVMEYNFNPPKNDRAPIMTWLYKMEARPDCIHVHTTYKDVPIEWLGKKLIDTAELLKKYDEKMYNWTWLGKCIGIDELVFYMFSEDKHIRNVKNYSNMNFIAIGVDYGQMNATTFQAYAIDYKSKTIQGIDEYYYSGRDNNKQKSPSDYAKDFKEFKEKLEKDTKLRVLYVYIDPSARGLAEEIKRLCPGLNFPKVDNSVELGISRVQKLLSYERLFLNPKQKNLIAEMYQYSYDKDKLDEGREVVIKVNDHCEDATRYAVMGLWNTLKNILPMIKRM